MTVYRSRASQPLKWVVAFFVFVLMMGVTFSDAYGFGRDNARHDWGTGGNNNGGNHNGGNGGNGGNCGDDNPSPTAVPEPGTLMLLAGGLSALYVARRAKKDK